MEIQMTACYSMEMTEYMYAFFNALFFECFQFRSTRCIDLNQCFLTSENGLYEGQSQILGVSLKSTGLEESD